MNISLPSRQISFQVRYHILNLGCKMRVFISHSSADKPAVEPLARALRDRGIDAWQRSNQSAFTRPHARKPLCRRRESCPFLRSLESLVEGYTSKSNHEQARVEAQTARPRGARTEEELASSLGAALDTAPVLRALIEDAAIAR